MSPTDGIELGRAEIWHAAEVGVKRRVQHHYAFAKGEKVDDPSTGATNSPYWCEIEGAIAEYAAAKYMGRYWPGDWWSRRHTVDIPPDIEVRWTKYTSGHLILHDDDSKESKWVLVTGEIPVYHPVGWILGRDALVAEFCRSEGGELSYWVPQARLRPISELCVIKE